VSSNISQSYPYRRESEADRAAAVASAFAATDGLEERVAAEATPLGAVEPADHGSPLTWWTWVCHACLEGRLHVAGYARDRHALYTVCDHCGGTFLR
jgi:hypothetical protein